MTPTFLNNIKYMLIWQMMLAIEEKVQINFIFL